MKILTTPHPALNTKCRAVLPDELEALASRFSAYLLFMKRAGGVGLSGPQIGDCRTWFVWDHGMVINPIVEGIDGFETNKPEGCLSLPGVRVNVPRHETIDVQYIDERLQVCTKVLRGLPARIFQHECDHLNGLLITRFQT